MTPYWLFRNYTASAGFSVKQLVLESGREPSSAWMSAQTGNFFSQ
jgi:hypothetical protein